MKDLLHRNASGKPDGQGEARLEYLRGSRVHEGAGNNYRTRAHLLGDVVHSAPYYVGEPPFYPSFAPGYAAFRDAYKTRTKMVYIGANDGMLHGFDATSGEEALAYVPRAVFANLSELTSPGYVHRYYVDGSPTIGDAHGDFGLLRCDSGSPCWRSVLVSGLRHGGQGVFALDVTNPEDFDEDNAGKLVLWEFTDGDNSDLGYTYSQPSIVRMANNRWAAVFGNGYNNTEADADVSSTGHAVLYIVFLDGGLDGLWTENIDYIKIDTGVGTDKVLNGLATPAVVDIDGDYTADIIYAGDLQGNLWRFDVRKSDPAQWKNPGAQLLFNANAKPITTRPEVGIHPQDPEGLLIYFGTGKYLEQTDHTTAGVPTQTFYAIWDEDTTATDVPHNTLRQQTLEGLANGARVTSNHATDWTQHAGWYMDLETPGERSVSRSVLRNDRIIFTTFIPDAQVCGTSGTGWLMELNAFSGSRLDFPPFDLNGDHKFDDQDLVDFNSEKVAISGLPSPEGILSTPAILTAGKFEQKYSGGSSGKVFVTTENPGPGARGRQAWRTLP